MKFNELLYMFFVFLMLIAMGVKMQGCYSEASSTS